MATTQSTESKVNPLTFTGFLSEIRLTQEWPRVKSVIDEALSKSFEARKANKYLDLSRTVPMLGAVARKKKALINVKKDLVNMNA